MELMLVSKIIDSEFIEDFMDIKENVGVKLFSDK